MTQKNLGFILQLKNHKIKCNLLRFYAIEQDKTVENLEKKITCMLRVQPSLLKQVEVKSKSFRESFQSTCPFSLFCFLNKCRYSLKISHKIT